MNYLVCIWHCQSYITLCIYTDGGREEAKRLAGVLARKIGGDVHRLEEIDR
ncbi:hypothetical protein [Pseudomonas brassicacearum]|uniref:hypothetical protein n=1 Tax=Pseudomonas brassicacearum TaxID=930166 RepID=UPI001609BEAE|nr:hypothetical protein [Pseudomonas brassicacearum]